MPKDVTDRFMQALQQAEASKDPSPLIELYAEDSSTENLATPPLQGREGAQQFWTKYLDVFQDIRSEFFAQADSDTTGVMEWTARGHLKDGKPIEYKGVSIIDVHEGQVKKFRTYYDSAAFVEGVAK
ncbi:nuclear transport factor 2 family protein [Deinococcus peraridilitoris]|uniref:Ketosteroid isomerase-like protein n=1 Tax=Deinococcus peraridilitoris (strain DSM 19664 / LMG 22246 / CIP 109416 / KR-200) TaxID=937777 RepID=K9ZYP5_DEIPD|nr:nuclear transport factor 2 family protein [Deinococcus peraridilitoris]AFZ65880.1 ketosteroid isomerase-like protein [Deinococcus peraridilitoris DSM 19664]